ncbi:hypothetical protein PINS_up018927 [Pythium insidiosum]|nr:hypothetical protein PINS_up018927 [Pythium insidiosum]
MTTTRYVLTHRELFKYVLTFLPGLPGWLLEDLKQTASNASAECNRASLGLWIDSVIERGDRAMLERFLRLRRDGTWLSSVSYPILDRIEYAAIDYGQYELAKWMFGHGRRLIGGQHSTVSPVKLLHVAVTSGRLSSVEWVWHRFPSLCDSRTRVSATVMRIAVGNGVLDVVEWLIAHALNARDQSQVPTAVNSGNVDMVQCLLESGYKASGLEIALRRNDIVCAELLLAHGAPREIHSLTVLRLVEACDVTVVRFLDKISALPAQVDARTQRRLILDKRVDVITYFIQHQRMQPTSAELYYCVEMIDDAAMLRLLLQHSTGGCLFKARKRARDRRHAAAEQELTRWIDPCVTECNARSHGGLAKRRRCQKVLTPQD